MAKINLINLLLENRYIIDHQKLKEDETWEIIDIENDYIEPSENIGQLDEESIINTVLKHGTLDFEAEVDGIDDTTDGTFFYYKVLDQDTLNRIAKIVADEGNENYEIIGEIQKGKYGFLITHLNRGILNTDSATELFFIKIKGMSEIEKVFKKYTLK